jgi:hypothetical protein
VSRRVKPILACLLIGLLAAGYYWYDVYWTGDGSQEPDLTAAGGLGGASLGAALGHDQSVLYYLQFTCGHDVSFTPLELTEAGLDFLVYDLERTAMVAQGGLEQRTVLSGQVPLPCRDCQNSYLVCEKDGYVAVYRGHNRDNAVLIQRYTDMPVSRLPQDVQQRLREGILVQSEQELARVLEGLDN